jgi:uncharacterized protein YceH (UPF0502 family)
VALLATLLLRGSQTAAELRAHSERLHRFADVSSVEAFLVELAERAPDKGGALVQKLPRAPGSRESRWVHLLCGAFDVSALPVAAESADFVAASELAALKTRQAEMQLQIDELRALVDRLYGELGVPKPATHDAGERDADRFA